MLNADELVALAAHHARHAHQGQVDKQGRDYFTHHLEPIATALTDLGAYGIAAGYLHDIVEDHGDRYPLARLGFLGFPRPVLDAVDSVTRRPGESYDDLITRACQDPLGVHVKLADNTLNIASNPGLAVTDQTKAEELLTQRYLPARDRLIAARAEWDARASASAPIAAVLVKALYESKIGEYGYLGRPECEQFVAPLVPSVERLIAEQRKAWEADVLWRCVETMPATGEAPDFMRVVSTAIIDSRPENADG